MTSISKYLFLSVITVAGAGSVAAQTASPTPLVSDSQTPVTREKREQAYAKMLEGQRYIWNISRQRSQTAVANLQKLAKESFKKAIELDPTMAEAYTALAELALSAPGDVDEAILLATVATKISPDNFGSRRILARLFTFKSDLNTAKPDKSYSDRATAEWLYISKLDPRNAEAWAFLSAFYEKAGKSTERIDALRKWISSAPPLDTQFYRRLMGQSEELTPENASLKLGAALLAAGKIREAIETLSVVVSDEPDNTPAIELLREAVESAQGDTAAIAIESLQQAVYANPQNGSLVNLLAQVEAKAGRIDEAAKLLRNSAEKTALTDKPAASALFVSLGDLYHNADKFNEAVAAYDEALKIRGFDKATSITGDDREFVMFVYEKIISTYKTAERPKDVVAAIERVRKLLGNSDLFADQQLISYYRETGKRPEALAAVRSLRLKRPDDAGFVRLEATLLTENGKVDEAVALVNKFGNSKPVGAADSTNSVTFPPQPAGRDLFSDYLFISSLYSQASRGKEAVAAANQALTAARGVERRQIAKLTLATAQQMSGDFNGAEVTLRDILKETPGNPIALNNLGYFLLERNERLGEALDLILQAVKVEPSNPSYLDSLGWAYFKLGKLDEAEKYLKAAARLDTSSGTIQEHLGDVYAKQGKADLAKAAWEKALNLASDPADINRIKTKLR